LANVYTATYLLDSLKRRGMFPTNTGTFSTADYLSFLNEELQSYVMALLMSVNEEYGVTYSDVTVTAGTAAYPIPSRAVGNALRDVRYREGSDEFVPLGRLEPERLHSYQGSGVSGYYLEGDRVVLHPSPTTSATLRLSYVARPSRVVETTAVSEITAINGARTGITVSATIPATYTAGAALDAVRGSPGFATLQTDNAISSAAGTGITLTTALPTAVSVGDYLCLAGESPIPQCPVECHPLLAHRTTARVLEALGDPKAQVAEATCEKMSKSIATVLSPRVKGSARLIINYNAPGFGGRRWR
jgi:hypothetical protein